MARFRDRVNFPQAFAEVALIAFGILAALLAQNWWESRLEQQKSVAHLTALRGDFIHNRELIDEYFEKQRGTVGNIDELLQILSDPDLQVLPQSFQKKVGLAYTSHATNVVTVAYEDLINSGDLYLISSEVLRQNLNSFVKESARTDGYATIASDSYYNLHSPFLDKYLVVSNFGWFPIGAAIEAYGLSTPVPESPHSPDIVAIKSREFWNLLVNWKVAIDDTARGMMTLRTRCDEILVLIEQEIAKLQS